MIDSDHDRKRSAPSRNHRSLGHALIVEDDGLIALDLAEALSAAGAESVVTCSSIAEAMEHLSQTVPALLILDVHLADRDDGWALAELATQLGDKRPLVVFTTGTPDSIPPSAAQLGHVLAKPFRIEELIALVHRHTPAGWLGRIRGALGNLG